LAHGTLAIALPMAVYNGFVEVSASSHNSPQLPITGAGLYRESLNGSFGDSATSQITVSATPVPGLSSSVTVSSPAVNGALPTGLVFASVDPLTSRQDQLAYSLEFLGPTGMVPIDVNAQVTATSSALPPGGFSNE